MTKPAPRRRREPMSLYAFRLPDAPRWTLQNRPFVDGSKPAISGGRDRVKVYRVASSWRKSA
jgi:hypothetical protein